jgi:hypothetical protein
VPGHPEVPDKIRNRPFGRTALQNRIRFSMSGLPAASIQTWSPGAQGNTTGSPNPVRTCTAHPGRASGIRHSAMSIARINFPGLVCLLPGGIG